MSYKVHVGPPQIAIHQGQTVLVSEPDGQITWPSEKGLYFLDTRVVSNWAIYANGELWELLNGGPINYHAARIFLTNKTILIGDGSIAPRTIGLTIGRSIIGGMHEDLDITNNSMNTVHFQLEVALRCDFADIFEVKSGHIVRRGRITTEWSERRQRLRTAFEPRFSPLSNNHRVARNEQGRFRQWATQLRSGASAARGMARLFVVHAGGRRTTLSRAARLCRGKSEVPVFPDDDGMAEDSGQDRAAGLPWFVAPFGRDSLIVSLQNILIYPEFARGALEILGSLQAKGDDPYRDAEPGKIFHELRCGELAHFKLIRTPPITEPRMRRPSI